MDIEQRLYGFDSKYKEGLTVSEVEVFIQQFTPCSKEQVYEAMGVNSCLEIDGEVIIFRHDLLKGLNAVLYGRRMGWGGWD